QVKLIERQQARLAHFVEGLVRTSEVLPFARPTRKQKVSGGRFQRHPLARTKGIGRVGPVAGHVVHATYPQDPVSTGRAHREVVGILALVPAAPGPVDPPDKGCPFREASGTLDRGRPVERVLTDEALGPWRDLRRRGLSIGPARAGSSFSRAAALTTA